MPDFPKGATPADVWGYATRAITDKADFALSAASRGAIVDENWDELQSGHIGAGSMGKRLDTDMSTRSSHAAADIWGVATRALTDKVDFALTAAEKATLVDNVWDEAQTGHIGAGTLGKRLDADITTRSSHAAADIWGVTTRALTGLTGQPRTDLIGSDASFDAATGRPAKLDDIPYFEAVVEGSLLMTGLEQTLVEKIDDKAGLLEGMINLTPMASGDTIVIREYMQVLSTGTYAKYAEETYTGAQTIPLLQILTKISTHDIKVTIQQTGTYKTFEYSFVRRREA